MWSLEFINNIDIVNDFPIGSWKEADKLYKYLVNDLHKSFSGYTVYGEPLRMTLFPKALHHQTTQSSSSHTKKHSHPMLS